MTARHMLAGLCVAIGAVVSPSTPLAQLTPLRVGPLTVNVPPRWVVQTNGVPVRMFSPESNPTQFFSVEFFPPEQTPQDLRQHHAAIWERMAAPLRAPVRHRAACWVSSSGRGPTCSGTGGQRDHADLYSAKTGSVYVAIGVDANRARSRRAESAGARGHGAHGHARRRRPAPERPRSAPRCAGRAGAGNPATLGEYVYDHAARVDRQPVSRRHRAHVADVGHERALCVHALAHAAGRHESRGRCEFHLSRCL